MDRSDFEAALSLPFVGDSSLDTVAVGGLVTLASFTTPLAGVLLAGYVLRLVRAGHGHATALPTFEDVLDVTVEGIRLSAVLVALQTPAVVLASVVLDSSGVPLTVATAVSDPRLLRYVEFSLLDAVGLVVVGCAALAGTYLGAAAAVALARDRSLGASLPQIRTLALDRSFLSAVSASALVVFGGRLLGFVAGAVPFVGVVLTACVWFLTLVAAATLLGRGTTEQESVTRPDQQSSFDAAESV